MKTHRAFPKKLFKQMLVRWGSCARSFLERILHSRAVRVTVYVVLVFGLIFGGGCLTISVAVRDKMSSKVYASEILTAADTRYDCILVLGCRVYEDGTPSPMLYDRVSVASSLYLAGLADQVLMSGDGRMQVYNEVECMKTTATSLGVPEEAILTDAYGLSTYDSIARAVESYRGKRVLIVTQKYHLYRAVYIAEKMGLDADGAYADLRPYAKQYWYDLREVFARCKDVYYGLKQPPAAKP